MTPLKGESLVTWSHSHQYPTMLQIESTRHGDSQTSSPRIGQARYKTDNKTRLQITTGYPRNKSSHDKQTKHKLFETSTSGRTVRQP